ncbi:hypothetical protein LAZ67_21002206 [Cordylochernes scorpioides]|uniref:Retrotransposon gag domain-containing protein n=1 Tax=Cordylochernes scorpioides TaxID=51811 RepID=A0ABY6LMW0_9ARAC|nr:hypothetical protein LAZ67_21002206 [Cordylochernes scorpioides]
MCDQVNAFKSKTYTTTPAHILDYIGAKTYTTTPAHILDCIGAKTYTTTPAHILDCIGAKTYTTTPAHILDCIGAKTYTTTPAHILDCIGAKTYTTTPAHILDLRCREPQAAKDVLFWIDVCHIEDCKDSRVYMVRKFPVHGYRSDSRHRTTEQFHTCTASPARHVEKDFWAGNYSLILLLCCKIASFLEQMFLKPYRCCIISLELKDVELEWNNPFQRMNKDKNQTPSEVGQIDERVQPPSAPITLENLVTQLTIALQNLRPKARQDLEMPKYDGTYPAQSFFETYDNQANRAGLSASEKLDRLPLFLVQQPLQYFHQLRLDTRNYFQARDTLLDLYPSTSEATYSKYFALRLQGQSLEEYYRTKTAMGLQLGLPQEAILETLTEGLPFGDQQYNHCNKQCRKQPFAADNTLLHQVQTPEQRSSLRDAQIHPIERAITKPIATSQIFHVAPSQVPIAQISQVPIEQTSQVPIEQTPQVPIEQTSQVPIEQTSQVPIEQTSQVPIAQTSQVPIDQTSQVPIEQTSQVPIEQTSQDPTTTDPHELTMEDEMSKNPQHDHRLLLEDTDLSDSSTPDKRDSPSLSEENCYESFGDCEHPDSIGVMQNPTGTISSNNAVPCQSTPPRADQAAYVPRTRLHAMYGNHIPHRDFPT